MDEIVIQCRKQSISDDDDAFLYRVGGLRGAEIAAKSRRNPAFSVAVAYQGGEE
jgi:hypothetical protein